MKEDSACQLTAHSIYFYVILTNNKSIINLICFPKQRSYIAREMHAALQQPRETQHTTNLNSISTSRRLRDVIFYATTVRHIITFLLNHFQMLFIS